MMPPSESGEGGKKTSLLTCKAKPEIEKTIRHVEARLTTGVNTRGCVKLPLRASRGLI